MSTGSKKICCHCKELFQPEPRSGNRQNYCSLPDCRKASKRQSQRNWQSKEENRDYFRGPDNVERVRRWRMANPGYWKNTKRSTLQDISNPELPAQVPENARETEKFCNITLQDISITQPLVLIGLISQMTGSTLQDDIASTWRNLIRRGQDLMSGGNNEQTQSSPTTRQSQAITRTVQLGRPTSGP